MSNDIVAPVRERFMAPRNPEDAASRRIVTRRLRRFFADLTTELTSGSAEIWNRAERRRARMPAKAAGEAPHPQPVQQQQSKAKPDGEK